MLGVARPGASDRRPRSGTRQTWGTPVGSPPARRIGSSTADVICSYCAQNLTPRVPRNAIANAEPVSLARRPRLGPDRVAQGRAVWCVDPVRVVLARVSVAGLGSLPSSVVARAAVPGLGARLFGTRPFRSGATRLAVVPSSLAATQTFKISGIGNELHIEPVGQSGRWTLARCRRTDGSSGPRSAVSGAHGRVDRHQHPRLAIILGGPPREVRQRP
jgi:hypothetical protein